MGKTSAQILKFSRSLPISQKALLGELAKNALQNPLKNKNFVGHECQDFLI